MMHGQTQIKFVCILSYYSMSSFYIDSETLYFSNAFILCYDKYLLICSPVGHINFPKFCGTYNIYKTSPDQCSLHFPIQFLQDLF